MLKNSSDLFDQIPLKDPIVPFRDLRVTDSVFRRKLLEAVEDVLVNGPVIAGKRVEIFEDLVVDPLLINNFYKSTPVGFVPAGDREPAVVAFSGVDRMWGHPW